MAQRRPPARTRAHACRGPRRRVRRSVLGAGAVGGALGCAACGLHWALLAMAGAAAGSRHALHAALGAHGVVWWGIMAGAGAAAGLGLALLARRSR